MDKFDEYKQLMTEATKHKKTDIKKSIEIIKTSIKLCPSCAKFDGYFRLVKFLVLDNQRKEAENLFQYLLNKADLKYVSEPFSTYSFVYSEMIDFYFNYKEYSESLKYISLSFWNSIARTALNGQKDHLITLISPKYEFPKLKKISTKIDSLKIEEFYKRINYYINKFKDDLITLAERYNIIWHSDEFLKSPFIKDESSNDRLNRLLLEDSEFSNVLERVRKNDFLTYIENH